MIAIFLRSQRLILVTFGCFFAALCFRLSFEFWANLRNFCFFWHLKWSSISDFDLSNVGALSFFLGKSTFCHPIFFGENLCLVARACFNLQDFVYSLQRYFFQSFCGVRFSKGALGPNFVCGSTKKVPAWWKSFRLTWLGESIYFPQVPHSFSMGTRVNIFSDLKKYHVEEWGTLFEGP